jgi:hypothetical protein
MGAIAASSIPVEMTADRRFARRVKRLGWTSLVALGIIWLLAVATLSAPPVLLVSLAAGWVLMPAVLFTSLAWPRLRLALPVPASLVGIALLAISAFWLPSQPLAAVGWLLIITGVALGGVLGLWFWFRLVPVPASLDDPYAEGRWALIAVHVGLIVVGVALAATGLLRD